MIPEPVLGCLCQPGQHRVASCLFMRSEIDWAKSWVVADILTRRSRISKPNFPRSCPDLAWCSVEQSHCHTVTLWLQVNNWSIPARSPWFCQTVMSGRSDNEVFLGSAHPGRLLTLWMIWWTILLFLTLITDWLTWIWAEQECNRWYKWTVSTRDQPV